MPKLKVTKLKSGLIKRIHVNGAQIRFNKRELTDHPVITVKTYNRNVYGRIVSIRGPSVLRQCFNKPLPSGAVTWIETEAEVTVYA